MYNNQMEEEYTFPKKGFFLFLVYLIITLFIIPYENRVTDGKVLALFTIGVVYVLAFYIFYLENKRIKHTYTWDKINAKVLSKKIIMRICIFYRRPMLYQVQIKYKYNFDKHEIISNTFALEKCSYFYELNDAKKLINKLVHDNNISIYINPKNQEESIIMQGSSFSYQDKYLALIISMISMILFAIYF